MRGWRGVPAGVVLGVVAAGCVLSEAAAEGGVTVQPGDHTGVHGPSVDLGASVPGHTGSAHQPGPDGGSDAGGPPPPVVPPGLSWSVAPGAGHTMPLRPQFGIPDFFPDSPAGPDVLAQQGVDRLELPLPVPRHSPDLRLRNGRPATVVGEHTWFWTDPGVWRPQAERVQAGASWVEVTAVPVRLSMEPGNGQPAQHCVGPGTSYHRSFGVHAASPDCDVVYERTSLGMPGEQVRAAWSITWRLTWRGETGTGAVGGVLPPMTSRAEDTFAVAEAQALRTG